MSYSDIDNIVRKEWEQVKQTIIDGVKFDIKPNRVDNNLLSPTQSQIIHVRPHTSQSAYRLHNGYIKGDIKDCDELANGELMTKQSFWLNNDYILSILEKSLTK